MKYYMYNMFYLTVQVLICQGHILHDGFTLIHCIHIYNWIQVIIKHYNFKKTKKTNKPGYLSCNLSYTFLY